MSDSKRQSRRSDPGQKPGKQIPGARPERAAWRRWVLPVCIIGILGGGVYLRYFKSRAGAKTAKIFRIAGSDAGYVESTACAGCHRQIWETYRRTGMGRSFARQGAETVVEDYAKNNTYYHRESDRRYTMYR